MSDVESVATVALEHNNVRRVFTLFRDLNLAINARASKHFLPAGRRHVHLAVVLLLGAALSRSLIVVLLLKCLSCA